MIPNLVNKAINLEIQGILKIIRAKRRNNLKNKKIKLIHRVDKLIKMKRDKLFKNKMIN